MDLNNFFPCHLILRERLHLPLVKKTEAENVTYTPSTQYIAKKERIETRIKEKKNFFFPVISVSTRKWSTS